MLYFFSHETWIVHITLFIWSLDTLEGWLYNIMDLILARNSRCMYEVDGWLIVVLYCNIMILVHGGGRMAGWQDGIPSNVAK